MSRSTAHIFRFVLVAVLAMTSLAACGGDDALEPIVPDRGDGLAEGPEAPEGVEVDPIETNDIVTSTTVTTIPVGETTTVAPSVEVTTTTTLPTDHDGSATGDTQTSSSTTSPPADGAHITVDGVRYALAPTDCDVWDQSDVLISGMATGPDGAEAYFAIDVTPDGLGAILLDFGSADDFDRSDETLVAGYGATPDEHFEATVTGELVQIETTFVRGTGSDPMPGTAEVDCSLM